MSRHSYSNIPISGRISTLENQINDVDQDVRYMCCNDLYTMLNNNRDFGILPHTSLLSQIEQVIIKALADPISEIQNLAIKW